MTTSPGIGKKKRSKSLSLGNGKMKIEDNSGLFGISEKNRTEFIRVLCQQNESLKTENETLREKIQSLENKIARLDKNSSNSSKPPSSDDITKPKKRKNKKKGKRKRGGQPGHPKHERKTFSEKEINEFHDHVHADCPNCANTNVIILDREPRVIQQMDIKEITITTHEHRSYATYCEECGEIHWTPFPDEVIKEGLFKTRITALVAYMKHVLDASYSQIRRYIIDVLGHYVSNGYLRKVVEKVGDALDAPYEELLKRLPLESRLNVDETGHKENGERFWTWVFKAELYVLFKIEKSRGSQVLIQVLGEEFNGALGCDYFSAYRKYMKDFNVTVQFCLAHLIRDVKYLAGLSDGATRAYGERLLAALKRLFHVIHDREKMSKECFDLALGDARDAIIFIATREVPSRLGADGKEQAREAQNMALRFLKHGAEYFQFITTPGIDPTNNVAEQAIRFIVIGRHVTQGTRSARGRRSSERLWTVIATCRLQGRSAFGFIHRAVKAFFNGEAAPSLLTGET